MLLTLDPHMYHAAEQSWKDWFLGVVSQLGLDYNRITYVEYAPGADVMWVEYLKISPDGSFYQDPKFDEPASDLLLFFLPGRPLNVFLYEWKKLMEKFPSGAQTP